MHRPARPADNVHTIQLPVAGCTIPEGRFCKMYGWGETKGTEILYSSCTTSVAYITALQVSKVSKVSSAFHLYCSSPAAVLKDSLSFFFNGESVTINCKYVCFKITGCLLHNLGHINQGQRFLWLGMIYRRDQGRLILLMKVVPRFLHK